MLDFLTNDMRSETENDEMNFMIASVLSDVLDNPVSLHEIAMQQYEMEYTNRHIYKDCEYDHQVYETECNAYYEDAYYDDMDDADTETDDAYTDNDTDTETDEYGYHSYANPNDDADAYHSYADADANAYQSYANADADAYQSYANADANAYQTYANADADADAYQSYANAYQTYMTADLYAYQYYQDDAYLCNEYEKLEFYNFTILQFYNIKRNKKENKTNTCIY